MTKDDEVEDESAEEPPVEEKDTDEEVKAKEKDINDHSEDVEITIESLDEELNRLKNSELLLYTLDRQLLSEGLSLILVLPITSMIFMLASWVYAGPSPEWWLKNIEPTAGIDFSTLMISLACVVNVGLLIVMALHRMRSRVTQKVFAHQVNMSRFQSKPVDVLHGYDILDKKINELMNRHAFGIFLVSLALIAEIVVIFSGPESTLGGRGILVSASLVVLALGQHLSTRRNKFNMVTPAGMLDTYNPPMHPSTLDMPFFEILETYMDPLLRNHFNDLVIELHAFFNSKRNNSKTVERILLVLYRRYKGALDREMLLTEMRKILKNDGVDFLIKHPIFSVEIWERLFNITSKKCPSFYRMIDRKLQQLGAGIQNQVDDFAFDVDLENVVTNKANLFCLFHNLSEAPREIVLRVQSPDFRPHDIAMKYLLQPGSQSINIDKPLPLSSKSNEDQTSIMNQLLEDGTLAWQSLIPERNGEASVSIRLEDPSGDLLEGRQINLRVRSEFRTLIRNTSSIICSLAGGLGLFTIMMIQLVEIFASL